MSFQNYQWHILYKKVSCFALYFLQSRIYMQEQSKVYIIFRDVTLPNEDDLLDRSCF
ncbi:Protein of unknown function [Gryllus bimaculatus]|nr:Protein of unknown function [Gryllus bimaculatus]